MRDEAEREPTELLERPRRLRPSWRRRLARLAVLAVGVAVIAQSADYALVHRDPDCAAAMHDKDWSNAVQLCQREYKRTKDPATGARLADAQLRTDAAASATRTASVLLSTSAYPEALRLLGKIAQFNGNIDDAIAAFESAREAHRAEQNPAELVKDVGLLAMIRATRGEFIESLRLADECVAQAHMTSDSKLWHYCHLVAAKALIRVGYWSAADIELEIATQFATDDVQRGDVAYQRASFAQETAHYGSAIALYQAALQLGRSARDPGWLANTELNLAYSLAEPREADGPQHNREREEAQYRLQLEEAERHLQNAALIDTDGKQAPGRAWASAQVAYHQHDLARATALTESYFQLVKDAAVREDPHDLDDRIEVTSLRARIELARGDLASAERWARQGIARVERMRGAQRTTELRPWVLAKRRAPYELLFTALARAGQVESAALVFDDWQGRTVQDALATPKPPALLDRRGLADHLVRLGNWLSVTSSAGFAEPADQAAVLSALPGIDLLALIVADGEIWRLTTPHGTPRLVRLASIKELRDSLEDFRTRPTDRALASKLGALLVPDEAFRTADVLHVIVDGQLGAVPTAALRHGDTLLITVRPIAYALRLPEVRCVPAAAPGHATVIGSADAGIPNAATEALQVAELLHSTSATGAAATRASLFAAAHDAVLHVAAHAEIGLDGGALLLADGEVSALEIAARRVAPTLAVLSACDTATSDDIELGGSLASAFLGAGSRHVVATLRPIHDAGAAGIMTGFYGAGGVADPVRALAKVQAELAKTDNRDWPYYAVFGSPVCRTGAPEHR